MENDNITFKGAGYIRIFDHERLSGQARGVYDLMSDGKWRTLSEINTALGYPEASISAQLRAFRRKEFGSHTVDRRRRGKPEGGLHEYRLVIKEEDPRAHKQKEVVELYVKKNLLKSTLVLGTGFGKSKVTLDIINELKPPKILILVNSVELKDFSWRDEFYKFGMGMIYERDVHILTYQSAYKWTRETHNIDDWLVIADEVDFAANVDEYSKFFYTFQNTKVLGLTGFITEEKKAWFADNLPVIYKYSIADAQDESTLNKMHFVFVKYELSKYKSKEVSYTKNGKRESFMTSENNSYEYQEKRFLSYLIEQREVENDMYLGNIDSVDYNTKMSTLKYAIDRCIKERNNILLNSETSITIVEKIKGLLDEKAKTVIFSVFTKQSDNLTEFTYNSKNSASYNKEHFEKFNNGEIRTLGVCGKIDRGVNISSLNTAIFESYYGSDTKAAQRLGRLARLNPKEVSTIYVLLPYYRYKNSDSEGNVTYDLRPTQQIKWCKNMLRTTKVHTHETLNWTHDK